jgi:hypothetical protein
MMDNKAILFPEDSNEKIIVDEKDGTMYKICRYYDDNEACYRLIINNIKEIQTK